MLYEKINIIGVLIVYCQEIVFKAMSYIEQCIVFYQCENKS